MRPCTHLAVLALLVAVAVPAWADGGPVARVQPAGVSGLEHAGGVGMALAVRAPVSARITVPAPGSITFGFQGPVARVAPRPIVTPSVFRGFGGFAARVVPADVGVERPLLPVSDVAGACGCDDTCDTDLEVDACGRVYETTRPREVTHQSSYYVPTYRRYVGTTRATDCDPCTTTRVERRVVRRYVVRPAYRTVYASPCYSSCYNACYRPAYRSCYRGCGWGPFWGGFGWGVGLGVGLGWAYGGGCW